MAQIQKVQKEPEEKSLPISVPQLPSVPSLVIW